MEFHERLVIGLQNTINSVSSSCYSHYLISEDTLKAVLELNLTNADKATKVLLNVKQTIEQKKDMFGKFISILDNFESCQHLAEEITGKVETLLKGITYKCTLEFLEQSMLSKHACGANVNQVIMAGFPMAVPHSALIMAYYFKLTAYYRHLSEA